MTDMVRVALIGATPALAALAVSVWNNRKVKGVHDQLNSRYDETKRQIVALTAEALRLNMVASKREGEENLKESEL